MHLRLGLSAKRRQGGGGGGALRPLLLEVLAGDQPAAGACRDDLLEALLAGELGLGVGDPLLERPQGEIGGGDLGRDVTWRSRRSHNAAPVRARAASTERRVRPNRSSSQLASKPIRKLLNSLPGSPNGPLCEPAPGGAGISFSLIRSRIAEASAPSCGARGRAGDDLGGARFADPRRRFLDIEIPGDGAVDQARELRIAERMPPAGQRRVAQPGLAAAARIDVRRRDRGRR